MEHAKRKQQEKKEEQITLLGILFATAVSPVMKVNCFGHNVVT